VCMFPCAPSVGCGALGLRATHTFGLSVCLRAREVFTISLFSLSLFRQVAFRDAAERSGAARWPCCAKTVLWSEFQEKGVEGDGDDGDASPSSVWCKQGSAVQFLLDLVSPLPSLVLFLLGGFFVG
jgi:hypothetical protein